MSKQVEAMQGALETLLWANDEINLWRGEAHGYKPEDQPAIMSAITALREALADHIPDDGKMVEQPQQEPFGYFKAEPLGWTDCAETDDGAVALYTRSPAQRTPLTIREIGAVCGNFSDETIRVVLQTELAHGIGRKVKP